MQILNIYDKEYTCSKCKNKVNYGQIADDNDKIITKDKKPFNKKYGKESNVLSAAVDIGTTNLHKCYASLVVRDFDELTGVIDRGHTLDVVTTNDSLYDEFEGLIKTQYVRLNILAGRLCGEGASAKDKHITTMGLIHDYFSFRATQK